ncbi:MAG: ABC transporter ATP-binding protein [Ferrovibrio sp.]|uniref:ABC transporter ATP-binding protein n=1 Tax=Ferrovibrio sp. TaxID=1917215 RepID=UPI002613B7EE|nr:ABC transporter ATP-binding protein [Ferrovibrio sp.]MCW0234031.1 ABC transporter ATP-binding protein [Ferrovibrio sp.]
MTDIPMIDIRDLNVTFTGGRKPVHAVNGVTLSVQRGEVLALLGESGSGKSVTLRSLLNMHPKNRTKLSGSVVAAGQDILKLSGRGLADYRGKMASMIFQEPLLALDPVYTVGAQITEAIRRHEPVSSAEAHARALALLQKVKIPSPERRLQAFPHEMSGGMRQRAMIALALACNPQILLADEPTTALDATVQIQILLLLRELQRELGLSVILVTHDIGVAVEVADRVAVMYAGRIVETGSVRDIIRNPRHPYTQGLLASRAHDAMSGARLDAIPGAPPDLAALPPGCSFAPRCKHAAAACLVAPPEVVEIGPGHAARCVRLTEAVAA